MYTSFLRRFISIADGITEVLGKAIAWLTLLVVLLTFAVVMLRYGFNLGWIAMQESVLYAHGAVFMLGASYTLKHDGHVRVDIFYQKFTTKQKAVVNLFGTLLLLLPVCIFTFYISYDYVALSWDILEKSKEPGGLPAVYLNKSLILLLVVTLVIQGLAEIFRNVLILNDNRDINGGEE
ncbi:TRAP transporter small permease subunit [Thalassotalea psychrophila]|uniref:TRAP transporter small permease protein n=1 Tax=Thalassotalea psychrophila TaxID=3065647 RepID=A0ABY9TX39_9GAMM|nr:TRAP transporter small permease subunit [Colwelliaceae bacterium SQ149]